MPPVRSSDLPASKAILGLFVKKSDTVSGVVIRLKETFPRSDWSRTTVHKTMPSLVKQGYVKLVSKGAGRGTDRYEATERGITHFISWVRDSAALQMRDAYQGRLSFAEWSDLGTVIGSVRSAEDSYRVEFAAAQGRMQAMERSARRSSESDWRSKLDYIQSADETELMGMMFRRFQKLGNELEKLVEEESG